MNGSWKGQIFRFYRVWCARCESSGESDEDEIKTASDFEKLLREIGWHKNYKEGWICPSCCHSIEAINQWKRYEAIANGNKRSKPNA